MSFKKSLNRVDSSSLRAITKRTIAHGRERSTYIGGEILKLIFSKIIEETLRNRFGVSSGFDLCALPTLGEHVMLTTKSPSGLSFHRAIVNSVSLHFLELRLVDVGREQVVTNSEVSCRCLGSSHSGLRHEQTTGKVTENCWKGRHPNVP